MRTLNILLLLVFSAPMLMAAQEGALPAGMVNPGYHEQPDWFKASFLDLGEDIAEARSENKRVLLYFYQDGCPYCAKLLEDNFSNKRIADKTRNNFDVIALNIWGDREVTLPSGKVMTEKQFAESLKVQYTPTLLFLDEQGKAVARLNGYYAPHKFEVALDYVAGRQEKAMKLAQYYASRNPKAASGKLNTEPFFLPHPLRLGENRQASWRPLLVIFEQKSCQACDEMHQEVLGREPLLLALSNLDTAQVDMRSPDLLQTPDGRELSAREWAEELGIQYAPSLVFFDSNGKEVFRSEAYLKSFHLHAVLDYVATGAWRHQPNFQRFVQHRADVLRAKGFTVDLMK